MKCNLVVKFKLTKSRYACNSNFLASYKLVFANSNCSCAVENN